MPLLVDTYNVLHVTGVLPPHLAGLGVRGLVDLLLKSRYRGQAVTLVCDGVGGPDLPDGPTAGIRALTSGSRRSADEVIGELVDRSTDPKRLTVVSSDREVVRHARRRRCRVMGAGAFLHRLVEDEAAGAGAAPKKKKAPPRPHRVKEREVDHWLEAFGSPTLPADPSPGGPAPKPSAPPRTPARPAHRVEADDRPPPEPPRPKLDPAQAAAFAGLLAEAEALVGADAAERARLAQETAARDAADAESQRRRDAHERRRDVAIEEARRTRELPGDVLREAAELASAADDEMPPPPADPTGREEFAAPPPLDSALLPDDLIAEAERLLREEDP